MEEAVKKFTVIKEKFAEIFINRKNTMPVGNVDQFKGHSGSAPHGIKISAGGAETAVAAEGNKL